MTIVGIDPGKHGGFAVWGEETVTTYKMPEELDDIYSLILHLHESDETRFFVEQIPKFCGAAQFGRKNVFGASMATLYGNYMLAVGICLGIGNPATHLTPQKWQKLVECQNVDKLDRGPWKNKLKARAQELFPGLKVTLDTADALLICFVGRQTLGM